MDFYIVAHKYVIESNYVSFTEEEKKRMLCWVFVNEAIPKVIPDWIASDSLIKEYELSVYDPLLQMNNFYQNSFFIHLNRNRYLAKKEYVGFGQYDMLLPASVFRHAEDIILKGVSTLFFMYPYPFEALYSNPLKEDVWRELVDMYNTRTKTNHTFEQLKGIPLILCHTFILPTPIFFECMEFGEATLPFCLKYLEWKTRHLAGTLERVIALALSFKILEGKFKNLIHLQGVEHIASQHAGDEMRGLNPGLTS